MAAAYAGATAVILLCAWRPVGLEPTSGFDPSWSGGLEMAAHQGLVFGRQVVFTYGPLGFLSVAGLWNGGLGVLAFLYTVALRLAFASLLFLALRRSFGSAAGFVLAVIVASVSILFLPELVVALILGVIVLDGAESGRRTLGICAFAGALAGAESLNKVSIGVSLAAMTGALVLGLPGRRVRLALAASAAFGVTVCALWIAVGQPVNALPDYLNGAVRITEGWTPAVSTEAPGLGWQYPVALVTLVLGLAAGWSMTTNSPARRRAGVLLLWSAFWFFAAKEGFVRHDAPHAASFLGALPAGLLAFRLTGGRRFAALLAAGGLIAAALQAQSLSLSEVVSPVRNLRAAVDQAQDVLSPARRNAVIAAGRAQIEAADPLDVHTLGLLRRQTVAIFPSEIAVAWAYRLNWDPLPLLQSYNTYTTALDELDADDLSSARAPRHILYVPPPQPYLDGRILAFDQPYTTRAIMCRYQSLYEHHGVVVLALTPDRCTSTTFLRTVRANWQQEVPVPPPPTPRSIVSVRVDGIGPIGIERLQSLLFKPRRRFIRLNGGRPNRLVTGTADDGLPLRVGRAISSRPPFNLAPGARTISVDLGAGGHSSDTPITFSFYAQTVR